MRVDKCLSRPSVDFGQSMGLFGGLERGAELSGQKVGKAQSMAMVEQVDWSANRIARSKRRVVGARKALSAKAKMLAKQAAAAGVAGQVNE